jgi:hypothetical protein
MSFSVVRRIVHQGPIVAPRSNCELIHLVMFAILSQRPRAVFAGDVRRYLILPSQ